MKIITIGSDRKIFEKGPAQDRILKYANQMEEMHVVIFTTKKMGFNYLVIGNLFLYPTNSLTKVHYPFDAYKIATDIASKNEFNSGNSCISAQDPFESGLAAYLSKRKTGLPIQIQLHTDISSKRFSAGVLNKIRLLIAKITIPRADRIRVVSEKIKKSIILKYKITEDKIDVLPIFVDIEGIERAPITESLKEMFGSEYQIVFMASRLTKEKNISLAIKAIAALIKSGEKIVLCIAGDGPEKQNLSDLCQREGIENNVRFLGWKENLVSYYKTCDLFLLTSDFEGYGMTLIEAGVAGSLVVATNVGIAEKILGKDLVCPVGDQKCLEEKIKKVLSPDTDRELLKRRVRDSIKNDFVSESEYLDKYTDLLKRS